jgi:hypothetical protein
MKNNIQSAERKMSKIVYPIAQPVITNYVRLTEKKTLVVEASEIQMFEAQPFVDVQSEKGQVYRFEFETMEFTDAGREEVACWHYNCNANGWKLTLLND